MGGLGEPGGKGALAFALGLALRSGLFRGCAARSPASRPGDRRDLYSALIRASLGGRSIHRPCRPRCASPFPDRARDPRSPRGIGRPFSRESGARSRLELGLLRRARNESETNPRRPQPRSRGVEARRARNVASGLSRRRASRVASDRSRGGARRTLGQDRSRPVRPHSSRARPRGNPRGGTFGNAREHGSGVRRDFSSLLGHRIARADGGSFRALPRREFSPSSRGRHGDSSRGGWIWGAITGFLPWIKLREGLSLVLLLAAAELLSRKRRTDPSLAGLPRWDSRSSGPRRPFSSRAFFFRRVRDFSPATGFHAVWLAPRTPPRSLLSSQRSCSRRNGSDSGSFSTAGWVFSIVRQRRTAAILTSVIAAQLAVYASVYFFTYLDPADHIRSSFFRISAALLPAALIALAAAEAAPPQNTLRMSL